MDIDIVILAAGVGSRMSSAVHKLLHCVGGRPLLSHVLATARELSPNKISVIAGHQSDALRAIAGPALTWISPVAPKGTGYAVRALFEHAIPEHRVLVLYGDVPLITAKTLQAFIQNTPSDALGLLTMQAVNPLGLGRIVRNEGQIERIVEEKDATEAERLISEVNTGIFLLPVAQSKKWLDNLTPTNAQAEYYLTDLVAMARAEGVVVAGYAAKDVNEFLGVNTKAQLAAVEREYQGREAMRLLEQGVTLVDPARLDVRGVVRAGRDVLIDVNVVLEGDVVLGDGVVIEPFCHLKNVRLGNNVKIRSFSHIEGALVDSDALIGPYARVRPGTEIKSGARIGNFVEIKKSIIGQKSKVNHLSYVGDAMIGPMVNVGAGTVTCNFDGHNKHETIIEAGASIGSGTMLVAPITIGKGATVGAGSVLTKSAPADQLTLARAKQMSLKHWVSPLVRELKLNDDLKNGASLGIEKDSSEENS